MAANDIITIIKDVMYVHHKLDITDNNDSTDIKESRNSGHNRHHGITYILVYVMDISLIEATTSRTSGKAEQQAVIADVDITYTMDITDILDILIITDITDQKS